jgi:hypothetical protein
MKKLITLSLLSFLLLFGCNQDSEITSPEVTSQFGKPNWVKLPTDISQGMSIETQFSASKLIEGKKGGDVKLEIDIKRPGHQFGDFKIKTKVKVKKHSFPDGEEILFTITLDTENAVLNITPSPHTLNEHIEVECEIQGIDVSGIDPETFDFVYVADNNEVLETDKDEIKVDFNKHKIKVKKAKIHPVNSHASPPGNRYGWVR